MAEHVHIDVQESCPIVAGKPEAVQQALWDVFEKAVALAEAHGIPEAEVFQFLEDVIDHRASERSVAEMENEGKKPASLDDVERDLGL